jgi:hypothetical protein
MRKGQDGAGMHASIWKFAGDPDDLLPRYDAVLAQVPSEQMRLHLCLRAPDGILMVDTCPSPEAFQAFAADPGFRALLAAQGLPEPERIEDFPVHLAYVDGAIRRS